MKLKRANNMNNEQKMLREYIRKKITNIIKKNENKIDYWCSKKDNGI